MGVTADAERFDVVILGAGLAGSSLAVRLAEPRLSHLRVAVLEPRTEFLDDRTWCSWRTGDHPFQKDVGASWRRLEVRWPGGSIRIEPGTPYDCLSARRFYDAVLPRLGAAPNISLRLGASALGVDPGSGPGPAVVEHGGGRIAADCVFDSRPPDTPSGALVQHFLGWEIETEAPRFDAGCATLMDFDVDAESAIHFVYVLPFGPRRALVESTWIEPTPRRDVDYGGHLRRWIADHVEPGPWRVVREERGCLPMTGALRPARAPSRHVPLGVRGGALRPSSGYAFARIQRASNRMADALMGDEWRVRGVRPPRLDGRLDAFMDRVFLGYLRRYPERAPALFADLFTRCSADRLVRFLAGTGGLRDRAAVMASLPTLPFVRQSIRGVFGAR
ncbi:MAG: lycopene cyclase family protein [Acidobacteriota bacterium]